MKRLLLTCLGAIVLCASCSKDEQHGESIGSASNTGLYFICEKTRTSLEFDFWDIGSDFERISIKDNSTCSFAGTMTFRAPGHTDVFYFNVMSDKKHEPTGYDAYGKYDDEHFDPSVYKIWDSEKLNNYTIKLTDRETQEEQIFERYYNGQKDSLRFL